MVAMIAGTMLTFQANAAAVTYEFFSIHGGGGDPYMTVLADDSNSAGSVEFTVELAGNIGGAQLSQLYLNLDPMLNASDLQFTYLGGTGPAANEVDFDAMNDSFKAVGSGSYDVLLDFDRKSFAAGDTFSFLLDGIGSLTALSFDFFSLDARARGPYAAAAKFAASGKDVRSAWAAGQTEVVPVPASVWMLGSALGFLCWKGRQTYARKRFEPVLS
jgi:hypothetical protein